MQIVLTGSSGRIGRAIHDRLAPWHRVVGFDRVPGPTTHVLGEVDDGPLLRRVLAGADAVIHAAALHAPHVGLVPDAEFTRVNVGGTRAIVRAANDRGVPRIVFTSTTALYGFAIQPGRCTWVDESTRPRPRTIYHHTKLQAEKLLRQAAEADGVTVRVLRMSRCFPEAAPLMAAYRLHRGIDARDVADAHAQALENAGAGYECYVVSGSTPFERTDADGLASDAPAVFRSRAPGLAHAFAARGWTLPAAVDRVYDASQAVAALGWMPRYGFGEVLAQLDRGSPEVLPPPGRGHAVR